MLSGVKIIVTAALLGALICLLVVGVLGRLVSYLD